MNQTKPNTPFSPPTLAGRIGLRVRLLRRKKGASQRRLAKAVGMSVDRLSLCERGRLWKPGHTALSAGELFALSLQLGVPVAYFFDEVSPDEALEAELVQVPDAMDGQRLVQAFVSISNPAVRRELLDLVAAIADRQVPL